MNKARVVVFAYHDVGYECLDLLLHRDANVVAVFSHDDNPAEQIWFRSVAELAKQHSVPVHTSDGVNRADWVQRIRDLRPDLIFSFYFRDLIGEDILSLAHLGAFNMHGSLLPKYRGRVPVNWAVLHGETQTGATLHVMVKRPDAGDIIDQQAVTIDPEETARDVLDKVAIAARAVLERQLDNLLAGKAPRRVQDGDAASYFGGRRPEDGCIDWTQPARSVFNLIRAVTRPYPGAFTDFPNGRLMVWWAKPAYVNGGEPGQIVAVEPLRIATSDGCLEISDWEWRGSTSTVTELRIGMFARRKY